jgi:hypothetical protein
MAGRKKLGKKQFMARVNPETPEKLKNLALQFGYQYGDGGATGEFLDAIASGEIEILINITKKTHATTSIGL